MCESLTADFAPRFDHVRKPEHALRQKTPFGHQGINVLLSGADAPYRHLEFVLGVWHDKYEAARLHLDLPPKLEGAFHFWQTTGNLGGAWPEFAKRDGRWDANLDEGPTALLPKIIPYLTDAILKVFDVCADLRSVRGLLELGFKSPLFTIDPLKDVVVIDATLGDWKHLRDSVQRKGRRKSEMLDPKLIKEIEQVFGIQLSNDV